MGVRVYPHRPLRYKDSHTDKVIETPTYKVYVRFGKTSIWYYKSLEGDLFTNPADADMFRAQVANDIKRKRFDPDKYKPNIQGRRSFNRLAQEYVDELPNRVKDEEIGRTQASKIKEAFKKYFTPVLGDMEVSDITKYEIKKLRRDYFPSYWSTKTVKNNLVILRTFFKMLFEDGIIEKIPQFPKIKVVETSRKWLTYEQQDIFFGFIPDDDRLIFKIMGKMALRPGEARAFPHTDMDFTKGDLGQFNIRRAYKDSGSVLKDYTKTRKDRVAPIHEEIIPDLRSTPRNINGFLCVNYRTGRPYTHWYLTKLWNEARKKAVKKHGKYFDVELYEGTRHSLASQAKERGVPDLLIQALMGHTSLSTTAKYAHARADKLRLVYTTKANS